LDLNRKTGRLLLAAPRGFCAGVERAVAIIETLLARGGGELYVRKEIVHNRAVVDDFAARGVKFVEELDEVPAGATVVFSAHGVSPAVREDAERRGLEVVDATCPLVEKVHRQVAAQAARGRHVLLIGHAGHDEVVGTLGVAPGNVTLVTGIDDAARLDPPAGRGLHYVTQTTLSVDETRGIVAALKDRFPELTGPAGSDICYATQNRQDAVKELVVAGAQRVLVVGSPNSSNSRRLCEVARSSGVEGILISGPGDLPQSVPPQIDVLGLTAGASAPGHLVDGIVATLGDHGWTVENVVSKVENVRFGLPPGLGEKDN